MWQKVNTFTYKHSLKNLKIESSDEPDIAILGAAALYFDGINKTLHK
jgi:hypothetical protein